MKKTLSPKTLSGITVLDARRPLPRANKFRSGALQPGCSASLLAPLCITTGLARARALNKGGALANELRDTLMAKLNEYVLQGRTATAKG